jgi:hypothetical protein
MSRIIYLLPIAFALMISPPNLGRANASPLIPHGLIAAPATDAQQVRRRGGAYVGRRGAVVAGRRGAVVAGRRGVVVAGRRGVVGRRYYGGVWYGTGRRYWHGRWWPYGVGSCWRSSPIGYVWVCG